MKSVIPAPMKKFYDDFHFSPGVIEGNHLRMSGMIGFDINKGVAPEDPEKQFTFAFENIKMILEEGGCSLADIVEMTTYHVDFGKHIGTFVKVKDRFIKEPYPAWTGVGTTALADPNGLVEVQVLARLPG